MKFLGALVLMVTLSAAYGLRCYICVGTSESCKNPEIITCPAGMDRCAVARENGLVAQSCISSSCIPGMNCCDEDLCNSAITAGSSVLLLLLSSAIITLFL